MDSIRIFIINFLDLYRWILFGRIILSWLPNISWYNQPWRFLAEVTEPVMAPFRKILPPLGGFDLSPILVFFILDFIISILRQL